MGFVERHRREAAVAGLPVILSNSLIAKPVSGIARGSWALPRKKAAFSGGLFLFPCEARDYFGAKIPTLLAVMSKESVATTAGPHHLDRLLAVVMPRGSAVSAKHSVLDSVVS